MKTYFININNNTNEKIIFSLAFLFIVHCTLIIEHCVAQWYPLPQFPTYLETSDVKFFDENTGLLTYYNYGSAYGTMRTTNGGLNWLQIKNCYTYDCQKIDSSIFYSISKSNVYTFLLRTFDKGMTWDSVAVSFDYGYSRLYFVNKDTGWVSGWNGGIPYIWKTTNGGVNLTVQAGSNVGGGEIFFYNKKVNGEYIGWVNNYDELWKTTNSGNNWFLVTCPGTELYQITFVDENTGWVCKGGMFKTTNGGLNWVNQPLAPGIVNIYRGMARFFIMNQNILYGAGGYRTLPNGKINALIWRTTNGGNIWGYQEIDTSFHIGVMGPIDFINENTGWVYGENGVKTTNGGGSFTSIRNNGIKINNYKLFQNYPNPFNPETNISYNIRNKSNVKIIVYDIIGKEIETLVNEIKQSGSYTIKFDANKLSSGIYFYSLIIDGITAETKKMIYLK